MSVKFDEGSNPIIIFAILCLVFAGGAITHSYSARNKNRSRDSLLKAIGDGRVYQIARRRDGVWEIASTNAYHISISCMAATVPTHS